MSLSLLLLCGLAIVLLAVVVLVLRRLSKAPLASFILDGRDEAGRSHVTFFPSIRQALTGADNRFLATRGSSKLARRVRKERRVIALAYLSSLRQDFLRLWRLARVIAKLSPRVGVAQELARLWLGMLFTARYELIRLSFSMGFAPLPELGSLTDVVSTLAMRMELAMQNLGERAALAANLASSLGGRGLDTP